MQLKYNIDDTPPLAELLVLSFQWLVVVVSILIIGGRVVAEIQYESFFEKNIYLQKIFFVAGVTLLFQLIFGHRLPLVVGPSSVLIVGIYTSLMSGFGAIYTAIAVCGVLMAIFALTGKFNLLRKFFNKNIVAFILILVAITLAPIIISLIADSFSHFIFSLAIVFSLFLFGRVLKGVWSSSLIFFGIFFGTAVYWLIYPQQISFPAIEFESFFYDLNLIPEFRIEVIIAFLICFLALAINDLSSIYSVGEMLDAEEIGKRVNRGAFLTGISNVLSGFFGVVGMVNYTLSPGMISATKCASRIPLLILGAILIIFAFFPVIISAFGAIPRVVVGSIFFYIMCSQIAISLSMLKVEDFNSGLSIGFPILLAIFVTFLPQNILNSIPEFLRPILGNGFVVGVLTAILMDKIILKK
ncbi:MAG: solute carrier family 23 protein [Archaeoglobaceae archaeon]